MLDPELASFNVNALTEAVIHTLRSCALSLYILDPTDVDSLELCLQPA